jgi:hypothetical protein
VITTNPLSEDEYKQILPLNDSPLLDFWSGPGIGRAAVIMVAPEHVESFKQVLTNKNIHHHVLIPDVGV